MTKSELLNRNAFFVNRASHKAGALCCSLETR
jgi:hypothetical protein